MGKIEELAEMLRRQIRDGEYPVGSRVPSEYELAELRQVNKTTANKAVALLVNEGLLERGAGGAGTRVRRAGRFPRGQLVAVLNEFSHSFTPHLLNGMQRAAWRRDYALGVISATHEDIDLVLRKVAESDIQGILTFNCGLLNVAMPQPIVYLHRVFPPDATPIHQVNCDNRAGAALLANRALSTGHRDIAIFTVDDQLPLRRLRQTSFVETLLAGGIADARQRLFVAARGVFAAKQAIQRMRARFPGLTAVLADSDDAAVDLLLALRELGLDCPRNLAVSGFGNTLEYQKAFRLTTIDMHLAELAAHACDHLLDLVESDKPDVPIDDILPVELVCGETL